MIGKLIMSYNSTGYAFSYCVEVFYVSLIYNMGLEVVNFL